MFMQISDVFLSDGFAFLYCRGWRYAKGVRNPNDILGVPIKYDQVPTPGLFWDHYVASPAPANTTINEVECDTRADMVFNGF